MIHSSKFYIKMMSDVIKKNVINNEDYKVAYNNVADTYQCWLEQMGKFTDRIIKPEYIEKERPIKILDFACGTGYISRKVLEKGVSCEITAVDISEKMLESCVDLIDQGVKVINKDGTEFLRGTEEKFDIIFCGWALPYFDHKVLLPLFKKVLNRGGIVGTIANSQGTLYRMEEIFLKVMREHPEEVRKPMDIRFNLPKGKKGLRGWFEQYGFKTLEVDEGEINFSFDQPEKVLDWINKTGASAGTMQIFKNYDQVKKQLIQEIKKQKYQDGQYSINHKFVYGVFKEKGDKYELE